MRRSVMVCGLVAMWCAASLAQGAMLGSGFTYQGQLKEMGVPGSGAYAMEFRLFDEASGGNQVGGTLVFDGLLLNPPPVGVTDGLFTVELDFGAGAYNGEERWLELTVEGTPLAPRQRLAGAPYAQFSTAPWATDTGTGRISYSGGNVGINTSSPGNNLSIAGGLTVDAGATNDDSLGSAIRFGGDFHGEGIASKKTSGGNQNGLDFYTNNSTRMQITNDGEVRIGAANDIEQGGVALNAKTHPAGGTGVYGEASTRYYFDNEPPTSPATAVRGDAYALSGFDVPETGIMNTDAFGVYGQVELDGPNQGSGFYAGVMGRSVVLQKLIVQNTYGVYSDGNFAATGTKAFHIDHPLDPENKTLKHYCSEGPEPLNIYSGTIVTDAAGTAWVTLPAYFESINRDPRYQLTVIGTFAQAIIGEKIHDNRFSIRTNQPNVEVSWRVEAVRNDRFVQRAGAPVEIEKSAADKGKYLVPALYDQPAEKGIFHHPAAVADPSAEAEEAR